MATGAVCGAELANQIGDTAATHLKYWSGRENTSEHPLLQSRPDLRFAMR